MTLPEAGPVKYSWVKTTSLGAAHGAMVVASKLLQLVDAGSEVATIGHHPSPHSGSGRFHTATSATL